ncbi:MAG TPA: class I SAM-dependent methyltransferase [Enhygromyxa sp.]|nr:class I SAM-dependent methyltransferase [Enhygromyxa sp.]
MTSDELVPEYLAPYTRAVAAYGTGFGSLLICDRKWQEARFAALAGAIGLRGRAVADLGSGRADLLSWLAQQGVACRRYVAVEAVPELHRFASARGPDDESTVFVQADFVRDTELLSKLVAKHDLDVLLFSGSLNTLTEADALAVLERAWCSLADRPGAALGFNFLAGGDDWPRPSTRLPRRDSKRWFAWACERTPLVIYCQHYLGAHDATIVMIRPDR